MFRYSGPGLRLYAGPEDATGCAIGRAIIGGARSGFYVRDVSEPVGSVGVEISPGAAPLLFGVPAHELAERHTPLEDLWGRFAFEALERIALARSAAERLASLESALSERLRRARDPDPFLAPSLADIDAGAPIRALVSRSGYSHRHFTGLFREAVGLTPKRYARVVRFRRALERAANRPTESWAELALAMGYSDQPHFQREFLEFTGLTPREFRELSPIASHHVPVRA